MQISTKPATKPSKAGTGRGMVCVLMAWDILKPLRIIPDAAKSRSEIQMQLGIVLWIPSSRFQHVPGWGEVFALPLGRPAPKLHTGPVPAHPNALSIPAARAWWEAARLPRLAQVGLSNLHCKHRDRSAVDALDRETDARLALPVRRGRRAAADSDRASGSRAARRVRALRIRSAAEVAGEHQSLAALSKRTAQS